ncbi:hypothetical protein VTL71DRAFT_5986 [Oculimacula yallundae]|uniref:2EXR domain-containing protein n=1 Tax=Oculimacula yallundae TaxID=86028 RepID=A0ABR4C0R5_9HELO
MSPAKLTPAEHKQLIKICRLLEEIETVEHIRTPLLSTGQCQPDEIAAMLTKYQAPLRLSQISPTEKEMAALLRKSISLYRQEEEDPQLPDLKEARSTKVQVNDGEDLPPRKFDKFSKLPFELRMQIWEMSISEPRVVEVYLDGISRSNLVSTTRQWNISQIQRACKESKQITEKAYAAIPHPKSMENNVKADSRILLSFPNDIFYHYTVVGCHFATQFTAAQRAAIRTIALPIVVGTDALNIPPDDRPQNVTWFEKFPRLCRIMWVYNEKDTRDQGTEIIFVKAQKKAGNADNEERRRVILDAWPKFVMENDKTGSLSRIEHCFVEVERPKPRRLLSREIRQILAREAAATNEN